MTFKNSDAVPQNMRTAYFLQRDKAKNAGIGWEISLLEWANWWLDEGRWKHRSRSRNGLRMDRVDDGRPYSLSNIRCARNDGVVVEKVNADALEAAPVTPLLGKRGDDHPRSQAIITPAGRFGSAALAASHYGKARQVVARWARTGHNGFRYDDGDDDQR
jgi:hypothetical protein